MKVRTRFPLVAKLAISIALYSHLAVSAAWAQDASRSPEANVDVSTRRHSRPMAGSGSGSGSSAGASSSAGSSAIDSNIQATLKANPCKSTGFALSLFKRQIAENPNNVLVSPFSAYAALSMALNGSAGETRDQMAKVLGVTGATVDSLNERNRAVITLLNSDAGPDLQLEIANAIYSDIATPFKPEFIEKCKQIYSAEAHSADFNSPSTVEEINGWCDKKTHGKIPKIVEKLKREEKMVLLNAVYFKGTWLHQFKPENTSDDTFNTQSSGQKPIKMMHQVQQLTYIKERGFEAVSIPYKRNHQTMYIFLPDKDSSLSAFAANLTENNWTKWTSAQQGRKVSISLPKFKLNYSTQLSGDLCAMGMESAFGGQADFSNLVDYHHYRAWISRVLQKTYMDVNEEGTEAAAVTAIMMGVRAMVREAPPLEFRVDRPFVLALVDSDSNEILFLGAMRDPSKES